MTREDFINDISKWVLNWAQFFNFGVPSAIIAQACLESGYGTSGKAKDHHNYFGLKYKEGRVNCNDGYFTDTSREQLPDGSYITISTKWFNFIDMNAGVDGYYQFIKSGRYKVEGITDPRAYLQALKDEGYATSINYVDNCMKIVDKYDLTRYDKGGSMVPDSKLVKGVIESPNRTEKRKYPVDSIIIHCMAGTYDAVRCGELFKNPARQASSTYGISSNGDIYQYVPERCRPWTTGGDKTCHGWTGAEYDHRSITIEVSNCTLAPWYAISAEAMQALINLCTDICKRYNINPTWKNDRNAVGDAKAQSFVVHRWFASKSCPGDFIMMCMPAIVKAVRDNMTGTGYIYNGVDYSPVFDPVYYANRYADLRTAFGSDATALWNHFTLFGMNELRRGNADFDPVYYKNKYVDLREAYGDDNPMYYYHWIVFGKSEGRDGHA